MSPPHLVSVPATLPPSLFSFFSGTESSHPFERVVTLQRLARKRTRRPDSSFPPLALIDHTVPPPPPPSATNRTNRLREMEDVARGLLRPGSWVVQGTLGLAYPGSFESHVCLADWWVV